MKVQGARHKRKAESVENGVKFKQLKISDTNIISKQKQFEKNVIQYIVNSMKPLSTVEDENFRKIFAGEC